MDLFHYRVSYEGNNRRVSVMGIDTTDHCGPYSNIDLVYVMWDITSVSLTKEDKLEEEGEEEEEGIAGM